MWLSAPWFDLMSDANLPPWSPHQLKLEKQEYLRPYDCGEAERRKCTWHTSSSDSCTVTIVAVTHTHLTVPQACVRSELQHSCKVRGYINPLGETGRELRHCDGRRGGWSVGWGSCVIKTTNNGTDTWMFMAIPKNGKYPKWLPSGDIRRENLRLPGTPTNKESGMPGPEGTNFRQWRSRQKHFEEYLSYPMKENSGWQDGLEMGDHQQRYEQGGLGDS